MRHWHMGTWIDGVRPRESGTTASGHVEMHGPHGPLVERNGAYAHRAAHVEGDPIRWVCFWACEVRHP